MQLKDKMAADIDGRDVLTGVNSLDLYDLSQLTGHGNVVNGNDSIHTLNEDIFTEYSPKIAK